MTSQDQLAAGLQLSLFEASLDEGTIRQRNNPAEQIQRMVITDRGLDSPFKIQVLLRACIHGMMSKKSSKPASLMVFDYFVVGTKEGARFSSIDTSFEFGEYVSPTGQPQASAEPALPSVVAFAPFEEPVRFNLTKAEETNKKKGELKLSPQVAGVGVGEVVLGGEKESKHDQRYFDRGLGGRHFEDERAYLVWWNLIHNKKQNLGVSPKFRVAILVERNGTAKFQAKFAIAARGSFGYKIEELKNKWIRKTAVDDPTFFDPNHPPMGDLEGVDKDELGRLKIGAELSALSSVWGLNALEKP